MSSRSDAEVARAMFVRAYAEAARQWNERATREYYKRIAWVFNQGLASHTQGDKQVAKQDSVLLMVQMRSARQNKPEAGTRAKRVNINLFIDDYTRLVAALKREQALREAAYWVIESRKQQGFRHNNSEVIRKFTAALGQEVQPKDAVTELKELLNAGVSDEFFAARARKLIERMPVQA